MDKRIKAFIDSGDMVREYGKLSAISLCGSYLQEAMCFEGEVDISYWKALYKYCKEYESNCNLLKG